MTRVEPSTRGAGTHVDEVRRVGRHVDPVVARRRRDPAEPAAVELHLVQLPLERRRLGGREVDRLPLRIEPFHPGHAPLPAGDLLDQLAGVVVAVDVLPAIAVGDPEELVRPAGKVIMSWMPA